MKSPLKNQLSLEPLSDLHTHTNCSDGGLSPTQLVEKALEYNLTTLAITDHDTTAAIAPARQHALGSSLTILNGCELTCAEKGKEYHLLAYCFDESNVEFQAYLENTRVLRLARCESMLSKLAALDIHVSMQEVLDCAQGQSIVRPHIAAALLKKEAVASIQDAFDRFLGNEGPAYVPIPDQTLDDAITRIHRAGGIAVIAHPARCITTQRIVQLLEIGLDGIEAFHPSHNRQHTRYYRNLAKQYDVLATGGSDFHGNRFYDEVNFSRFSVEPQVIEAMIQRAARHREEPSFA